MKSLHCRLEVGDKGELVNCLIFPFNLNKLNWKILNINQNHFKNICFNFGNIP